MLGIQVIYLIRDPRAVMSSRYKLTWCYQTQNCTSPEFLCERIRSNLVALEKLKNTKFKENIILLRHEDLVFNVIDVSQQLYRFLGSAMSAKIVDWIKSHTSVDDNLSNPHSTYRNIRKLPYLWQSELSYEELEEIQTHCADVMHNLGYLSINFESEDNMTEQGAQLVANSYPFKQYSISDKNDEIN